MNEHSALKVEVVGRSMISAIRSGTGKKASNAAAALGFKGCTVATGTAASIVADGALM